MNPQDQMKKPRGDRGFSSEGRVWLPTQCVTRALTVRTVAFVALDGCTVGATPRPNRKGPGANRGFPNGLKPLNGCKPTPSGPQGVFLGATDFHSNRRMNPARSALRLAPRGAARPGPATARRDCCTHPALSGVGRSDRGEFVPLRSLFLLTIGTMFAVEWLRQGFTVEREISGLANPSQQREQEPTSSSRAIRTKHQTAFVSLTTRRAQC